MEGAGCPPVTTLAAALLDEFLAGGGGAGGGFIESVWLRDDLPEGGAGSSFLSCAPGCLPRALVNGFTSEASDSGFLILASLSRLPLVAEDSLGCICRGVMGSSKCFWNT